MRKLSTTFLVLLLFFSFAAMHFSGFRIPEVYASTTQTTSIMLNVTSFMNASTSTDWKEVGANPWLNKQDKLTNIINCTTASISESNFTFADLPLNANSIVNATLYFYGIGALSTASAYRCLPYMSNSSGWIAETTAANFPLFTSWGWRTRAVEGGVCNSVSAVNKFVLKLTSGSAVSTTFWLCVDQVYLKVFYTCAVGPTINGLRLSETSDTTNISSVMANSWYDWEAYNNMTATQTANYISWYRGAGATSYTFDKIGFTTSNDGVHWNAYTGNPIMSNQGFFPYVVQDGNKFYMFIINSTGNIWLYNVTNYTNPTIMNSGNPVYTHNATTSNWDYTIFNPAIVVVNGKWHMLLEGKVQSGSKFTIGYAYSNLTELNWNKHRSADSVMTASKDCGAPDLMWIPERNAVLSLHSYGTTANSYQRIVASYASLSDDLSLAASWHDVSNSTFMISQAYIHCSDPYIMPNFNSTYPIMISYNYNQYSIYQKYCTLSLKQFYDACVYGNNTLTLVAEPSNPTRSPFYAWEIVDGGTVGEQSDFHISSVNMIKNVTIRLMTNPASEIDADSPDFKSGTELWFRYTSQYNGLAESWQWYSGSVWTTNATLLDVANCIAPSNTISEGYYLFRVKLSSCFGATALLDFSALTYDFNLRTSKKKFASIIVIAGTVYAQALSASVINSFSDLVQAGYHVLPSVASTFQMTNTLRASFHILSSVSITDGLGTIIRASYHNLISVGITEALSIITRGMYHVLPSISVTRTLSTVVKGTYHIIATALITDGLASVLRASYHNIVTLNVARSLSVLTRSVYHVLTSLSIARTFTVLMRAAYHLVIGLSAVISLLAAILQSAHGNVVVLALSVTTALQSVLRGVYRLLLPFARAITLIDLEKASYHILSSFSLTTTVTNLVKAVFHIISSLSATTVLSQVLKTAFHVVTSLSATASLTNLVKAVYYIVSSFSITNALTLTSLIIQGAHVFATDLVLSVSTALIGIWQVTYSILSSFSITATMSSLAQSAYHVLSSFSATTFFANIIKTIYNVVSSLSITNALEAPTANIIYFINLVLSISASLLEVLKTSYNTISSLLISSNLSEILRTVYHNILEIPIATTLESMLKTFFHAISTINVSFLSGIDLRQWFGTFYTAVSTLIITITHTVHSMQIVVSLTEIYALATIGFIIGIAALAIAITKKDD